MLQSQITRGLYLLSVKSRVGVTIELLCSMNEVRQGDHVEEGTVCCSSWHTGSCCRLDGTQQEPVTYIYRKVFT